MHSCLRRAGDTVSDAPSTRDRIVHAALRVIGTGGLAALTNRRVAAEAQVSLGSLTYHFDSQDDLIRESLLAFVAAETARITAIADNLADHVASVAEAAVAAQQAMTDMTLGPEELGVFELYVQSARDPALHEAVRACFAAYDRAATRALELLGITDADQLAPHVVALVMGSQLRRLATAAPDATGIADGLLRIVHR